MVVARTMRFGGDRKYWSNCEQQSTCENQQKQNFQGASFFQSCRSDNYGFRFFRSSSCYFCHRMGTATTRLLFQEDDAGTDNPNQIFDGTAAIDISTVFATPSDYFDASGSGYLLDKQAWYETDTGTQSMSNLAGATTSEGTASLCTEGGDPDLVWGAWSSCTQACHSVAAFSERTRTADDAACTNSETEVCSLDSCPYWFWSSWGTCGGTCGSQTRQRTATDCSTGVTTDCDSTGSNIEDEVCVVAASCAAFTWEEWSECTASCGVGFRSRIANGCDTGTPSDCGAIGQAFERDTCNPLPCFNCDSGSFTSCTATCGGGTQSLITCDTCLLPFTPFTSIPVENCDYLVGADAACNTESCLEYTWGEWNECSGTCNTFGSTAPTRTRTADGCSCIELESGVCINQGTTSDTADCDAHLPTGTDTETENCNDSNESICETWTWGTWGACSGTCAGTRSRDNIGACSTGNDADCAGQPETQVENCNSHSCPSWVFPADFSTCSETCGTGSQSKLMFSQFHKNINDQLI